MQVVGAMRRRGRDGVHRVGRATRADLAWTLRLTAAAVASYLAALLLFPHDRPPLTAPLTALLVVQLTPVSLLASGFDRVFSVVAGVLVAVLVSTAVHLTWWSLALVIAVSLLIGQALRLGSNLLEVPISAMLVLGVGSVGAESAGGQRIAETLVGAGVGVLSNLLLPPKVPAVDAGTALQRLAENLANLLDQAAGELATLDDPVDLGRRSRRWLDSARALTHDLPNVGAALLRAEQGRRLNLRALRTPDAGPGLRQGMEALEHCAVAVRGLFRSLVDASDASDGTWAQGDPGEALRRADALVLSDLAAALRAFGALVRTESVPAPGAAERVRDLRDALDGLREARARITELVLTQPDPSRLDLDVSLLTTVRRVLTELDLEGRARRQHELPHQDVLPHRRRRPSEPPG